MPDITISLEANIYSMLEEHAARYGLAVDELIREVVRKELGVETALGIEAFFQKADALGLRSTDGCPLTRSEIYNR